MNNRSIRICLAIALALILFFAVTPKLVGIGIRENTVDPLIDIVIPPEYRNQFQIDESSFENGWFSSQLDMNVSYLPLAELQLPMDLDLRFNISHGPLLFTPSGLQLGLAHALIEPQFDADEVRELLADLPFDMPEMQLEMLAGFDQSLLIEAHIDEVDFDGSEGELHFGGLDGRLLSRADGSGNLQVDMNSIRARDSAGQLEFILDGIILDSESSQLNDILAPAEGSLVLPRLEVTAPTAFTIEGMRIDSRISPSNIDTESTDFFQELQITTIVASLPLTSFGWNSEVLTISNQLIRDYVSLISDAQAQMNDDPAAALAELNRASQELGLLILNNDLEFNNTISMTAYEGEHSIVLLLRWQGLRDLDNLANLAIDEAILALEVDLTVDMDQAAVLQSPLAEMIDPYLQEGYLRTENGRIVLEANMQNGELQINGDSIPLEQFF